ncbi:MAG: histidine phosphatase family protein [Ktedonobacteraceae bacterium]|nr:histidine phosphatase family protein [Ktedonobacteraceae bacterium]
MTHLYLIRHGEATSQKSDLLIDNGLTPLGVVQAERLRDRLLATEEIQADVLIASTLLRARQTAEIIAPALKLPIIYDDDFQEMRIGEAEGMRLHEAELKFGKADFERDPFRPVAPGGEYWGQFTLRVASALDRVTRRYESQTIVIVCHGGIIDSSFLYFFNMNTLIFPQTHFSTRNTSITHWSKDVFEDGTEHWRLIYYNDDFHTRDIGVTGHIPWQALKKSTMRRSAMHLLDAPPSES